VSLSFDARAVIAELIGPISGGISEVRGSVEDLLCGIRIAPIAI
jgi:hypothetical protein